MDKQEKGEIKGQKTGNDESVINGVKRLRHVINFKKSDVPHYFKI